MKKPTVFISYSHTDSQFVDRLADELKASGVDVWIDKWKIKVGDSIIQRINEGIGTSDFLIVVLSRASVNSLWVREELNAATIKNIEQEKHAFILPVLVEGCEIPSLLRHRRYANFKDAPKQAFRELLDVIRQPTRARAGLSTAKRHQDWGNRPIIIILTLIAALITVFVFLTGKENLQEIISTGSIPRTLLPVSPTPSCQEVSGPFQTVWKQVQEAIGCASDRASSGEAAAVGEQNFEGGRMFWLKGIDPSVILVLFDDDNTWQKVTHTPFDGGTDTLPPCPPTSRLGFGWVWRKQLEVRSRLGNVMSVTKICWKTGRKLGIFPPLQQFLVTL